MATETAQSLGRSQRTLSRRGERHVRDHAAPRRTVFVRLESRGARLLVLGVTLGIAAWLASAIAWPAIADWLAAGAETVSDLDRAVAWDPGNPDLRRRLAAAYFDRADDGDLGRAREHLEAALRQRPAHGVTWLQLALLADREGDRDQARLALTTALRYDPHNVTVRWEAGLLALRWGDVEPAIDHVRYVIGADPGQADSAFQLARALVGPERVAALLPADPKPLSALLSAAVQRRDLPTARAVWDRRAVLALPITDELQRRYLELLVTEGDGRTASVVWRALMPHGRPRRSGDAVWNGSFETERLAGWGLDWQFERTWGLDATLDRFVAAEGRQSLRLTFNSYPGLDFQGIGQFVPVEPGREYRLRARLKAVDFNTQSGIKLQVTRPEERGEVFGETARVSGTTADWVSVEARIRIPADLTLVRVLLRREKAAQVEANLHGKIWLDDVTLLPAGANP